MPAHTNDPATSGSRHSSNQLKELASRCINTLAHETTDGRLAGIMRPGYASELAGLSPEQLNNDIDDMGAQERNTLGDWIVAWLNLVGSSYDERGISGNPNVVLVSGGSRGADTTEVEGEPTAFSYTVRSGDSYLNLARYIMEHSNRPWLVGLARDSRDDQAENHVDAFRIVNEVATAIEQRLRSIGVTRLYPGQHVTLGNAGSYVPRLAADSSSNPVPTSRTTQQPSSSRNTPVSRPTIEQRVFSRLEHGYRTSDSITAIVLHQTAASTASSTLYWYADEENEGVGAHYLVTKAGKIYQTARDNQIAWHVGRPLRGVDVSNANAIGIEFVGEAPNNVFVDITPAQQRAADLLIPYLQQMYNISDSRVYRHPQVSAKQPTEAHSVEF